MTKYNLEEFKNWVATNQKVDESKKQWFRTDKRINDPDFFAAFIKRNDIYCQGSQYNFGSNFEQMRTGGWASYREVVLEWVEEVDKKKVVDDNSQLQELSNLLFPNRPYNFIQLKQEIARLKHQELAPQLRSERAKFEQLITGAKNKAENSKKIVDLLLETQKKISLTTETSQKDKLNGKIEAYQSILEDNLTSEEIQNLLSKQTELQQLEEQLSSLQINEQQAQVQQTNLPPRS